MLKKIQKSCIVVLCTLLCACSKSILDNKDARCPFADRGGCQSMEMVNRMVMEKRYTPDGQFVQQANNRVLYSGYK
ncbi:TPA: type IV conjugative transfer system protein TraV [Legionella anisa]|uniref:type IV conjugative transfer system protein TraV n=1 Tax=Legionella anisa TaxID=28082 RepID=UPI001980EF1B|nr:type IV conjugative transfer system protein TraV [Legionella anisa]MBN5937180.1 type IV conjugative transfer system protein TraV [Legionella anisa]